MPSHALVWWARDLPCVATRATQSPPHLPAPPAHWWRLHVCVCVTTSVLHCCRLPWANQLVRHNVCSCPGSPMCQCAAMPGDTYVCAAHTSCARARCARPPRGSKTRRERNLGGLLAVVCHWPRSDVWHAAVGVVRPPPCAPLLCGCMSGWCWRMSSGVSRVRVPRAWHACGVHRI